MSPRRRARTAVAPARGGFPLREKPLGLFPVELPSFRLVIGPLVPGHPQPCHPLENRHDRFRSRPLLVGILDAQDERSPVAAGEQPVEEGGGGGADGGGTRRGGGGGGGDSPPFPPSRVVWARRGGRFNPTGTPAPRIRRPAPGRRSRRRKWNTLPGGRRWGRGRGTRTGRPARG